MSSLQRTFEDERYLLTPITAPPAQNLLHVLAVSDVHLIFKAALVNQDVITMPRWVGEYDIVNPDEGNAEKRTKLFTLLREYPPPRLVCAPDAAFVLTVHDQHRKVQYVEVSRETSGVRREASKALACAELFERRLHLHHFREATVERFNVIFVTLSAKRRDMLVRAFRTRPHADLWRFVSLNELTPDSCIFGAVYHRCHGEPTGLVRAEVQAAFETARATVVHHQTVTRSAEEART